MLSQRHSALNCESLEHYLVHNTIPGSRTNVRVHPRIPNFGIGGLRNYKLPKIFIDTRRLEKH
jgi:hypothetical protein